MIVSLYTLYRNDSDPGLAEHGRPCSLRGGRAEPDPPLGRVVLEDGKTRVDIADPTLKRDVTEILSHPIETYEGDPSGRTMATRRVTITPDTPRFLEAAVYPLRDIGVLAVMEMPKPQR